MPSKYCQVIDDKKIWEEFLLKCREKTFLDSWNWGEFQKTAGNKIWRLGVFIGQLTAVALVAKIKARRGTFLFLPHAPSIDSTKEGEPGIKREILEILLEELKKIAGDEAASFIRISPIWEEGPENKKIFEGLNFREAPIHMHPELTWELDITPTEDEILKKMRKTTRYLIRQGLRNNDIAVIESKNIADVERFNDVYKDTVDRHHFVPFSIDYLKNEFSAFNPDEQILIFLGRYKGEVISSAMIIFWQGTGFYHQGASSLKYAKIPASYLLQWEAIKAAKKRGCGIYNFWGIAPNDDPGHPWAGLSLFKMGFGGYRKEYVKTQDLPLSAKYWFTYFFEKLRKSKRGL